MQPAEMSFTNLILQASPWCNRNVDPVIYVDCFLGNHCAANQNFENARFVSEQFEESVSGQVSI